MFFGGLMGRQPMPQWGGFQGMGMRPPVPAFPQVAGGLMQMPMQPMQPGGFGSLPGPNIGPGMLPGPLPMPNMPPQANPGLTQMPMPPMQAGGFGAMPQYRNLGFGKMPWS